MTLSGIGTHTAPDKKPLSSKKPSEKAIPQSKMEKGNWSVYKVEIGRTKKLVAQYGRFE